MSYLTINLNIIAYNDASHSAHSSVRRRCGLKFLAPRQMNRSPFRRNRHVVQPLTHRVCFEGYSTQPSRQSTAASRSRSLYTARRVAYLFPLFLYYSLIIVLLLALPPGNIKSKVTHNLRLVPSGFLLYLNRISLYCGFPLRNGVLSRCSNVEKHSRKN